MCTKRKDRDPYRSPLMHLLANAQPSAVANAKRLPRPLHSYSLNKNCYWERAQEDEEGTGFPGRILQGSQWLCHLYCMQYREEGPSCNGHLKTCCAHKQDYEEAFLLLF